MFRLKSPLFACLIVIAVLTGCSSGKSAFEHGNYYEAVLTSVNRLRRNDDHAKSIETLRQAYPMAVQFYDDRAKASLASNAEFKWSTVVESYTTINVMYDEIRRCPGALKVIPNPQNYYTKLDEAKKNAAEENYAAGITAMTFATRDKAKAAYYLFKKANDYVPGYKDVIKMTETARWNATVKVVMEPIPVQAKNISVSAQFFDDKVSEYIHAASINEFVKFYTRKEAQTMKLQADHIIKIDFDEFVVGQVLMNEKESKLERDSVVISSYVSNSVTNTGTKGTSTGSTSGTSGTSGSVGGSKGTSTTGTTGSTATSGGTKGTSSSTSGTTGSSTSGTTGSSTSGTKGSSTSGTTETQSNTSGTAGNNNSGTISNNASGTTGSNTSGTTSNGTSGSTGNNTAGTQNNTDGTTGTNANSSGTTGNEGTPGNSTNDSDSEKVTICHIPPGNESNRHTLTVSRSALKAHLAHGDKEGACDDDKDKDKAKDEKSKDDKKEEKSVDKAKDEKEDMPKDDKMKEQDKSEDKPKDEKKEDKFKEDKSKEEKSEDKSGDDKSKEDKPEDKSTEGKSQDQDKAEDKSGDDESKGVKTEDKSKEDKSTDPSKSEEKPADVKSDDKSKDEKSDDKSKPKGESKPKEKGTSEKKPGNEQAVATTQPVFYASSKNDLKWLDYGTTTSPTDTVKIYATVKATLYHFKKTTTSKGVITFRIIDAKTNALLAVEKMPGEYVWISEWATFNGDERALSPEQLRLTRQREKTPPPVQDLFIEFARPIYDQVTTKIKNFYSGY